MTIIGVVTRLDGEQVWVELPRIAPGFHVGPLTVMGTPPSSVGDLVAVDEVRGQPGEYLCFGALTGGVPSGGGGTSQTIEALPFTIPGPLTVASPSALLLPIGADCSFLSLRLVVVTAPAGAAVTFDVLYNDSAQDPAAAMTSIYGATKPSIPAGGRAYWNAVDPTTTDFIEDSLLRIDVTAVGTTSPGSHLTGVLRLLVAAPT